MINSILGLFKMEKKLNKVDAKTNNSVKQILDAVKDMEQASNSLHTINAESKAKIDYYDGISKKAEDKIAVNNVLIDNVKNAIK